jgi:dynein heavy chain
VPEQIRKASEAAEGICKWVVAICKFDEIYKEITPKREALKAAEEKVAVVQEELALKKAELQKLIDQNAELQEEFRV